MNKAALAEVSCQDKKNKLNYVPFDFEEKKNTPDSEYIQWKTSQSPEYSNFMANTTAPQRNPYGITGNRTAMKYYESNKPERESTFNNPFMNVPITDFGTPQKYSKSKLDDTKNSQKNFYRNLFQSPDDALWKRQASERQFYTTPNTSVPNEQTKFAEWLYGMNEVGKSGSIYARYGYPYTRDSLVNTGQNAAEPQNAGQIDNNYGVGTVPGSSAFVNNYNYGYGFGGLQGGIPFPSVVPSSPMMATDPYPMYMFGVPPQVNGAYPPGVTIPGMSPLH